MVTESYYDKLIDTLLQECDSGKEMPDITDRILKAAYPQRRRLSWGILGGLAAAGLAAAVLIVAIVLSRPARDTSTLLSSYPLPQLTGECKVESEAGQLRNAVITTADKPVQLALGGYVTVDIAPRSRVRIDGREKAESIFLLAGLVTCDVRSDVGSFDVHGQAGTVTVTGTRFSVGVVADSLAASGPGTNSLPSGDNGMFVEVLEGSVSVSDNKNTSTWVHAGSAHLLRQTGDYLADGAGDEILPEEDVKPPVPTVDIDEDAQKLAQLLMKYPGIMRHGRLLRYFSNSKSSAGPAGISSRQEGLRLVQVLGKTQIDDRRTDIRLRISDRALNVAGECVEVATSMMQYGRVHVEIPDPSDQWYLARITEYKLPDQPEPKYYILPLEGYFGRRNKERLIAVAWTEGEVIDALSVLSTGLDSQGESVNLLDQAFSYMASGNPAIRVAATQTIRTNANRLIPDRPDGANRLADKIINMQDDNLRRSLAGVYSDSIYHRDDLLPTDTKLMQGLLNHPDIHTARHVLRAGLSRLRHYSLRQEQVLPQLREILEAGAKQDYRAILALQGIRSWGSGLIGLEEQLAAIATGTENSVGTERRRKKAVTALMLSGARCSDRIAMLLINDFPTASVMEHLARRQLRWAVPEIIHAVRSGKLEWRSDIALAMALLTGHFEWEQFQQYDQWWQKIENSGDVSRLIANRFIPDATMLEIRKHVENLGHPTYLIRQDAYENLCSMCGFAPDVLREATLSNNPELAVRASDIIKIIEKKTQSARAKLRWATYRD